MNPLRRLLLLLLLSAFPSLATHVAVLETIAGNDILKLQEKQYITDVLRSEAVKALPASMGYTIMTRDNIQTMLPPGKSIEDCEGSCLVETGKNISADYIAQARVGTFGNSLTVTVELYETAGNKLVGSFAAKSVDIEQLEVEIRKMASSLFDKVQGGIESSSSISSSSSETPAESTEIPAEENLVAVKIQTVPPEASIVVDGDSSKCTVSPCTLGVTAGEHRIFISAKNYLDKDTVVFFEGEEATIVVQLDSNAVQVDALHDKFAVAERELSEDAAEMRPVVVEKPAEEKLSEDSRQGYFKRLWGGLFVGATYNDFWNTEFGFGCLKSGDGYTLKVEKADGLLGNYWGVGVNAGVGGLFMFSPYIGLRTDVNVAFRQGKGRSDVAVKLFWNDETLSPEKSDLEIEYSEKQLNIDMPILLRVVVPDMMYVEAGPMASFNVYSKSKSDISDIYGAQEFENENDINLFEFDVAFGLGTVRHFGKSMLDFNLRFVLGITPLDGSDDSPKTWQGQFNVTYWFL